MTHEKLLDAVSDQINLSLLAVCKLHQVSGPVEDRDLDHIYVREGRTKKKEHDGCKLRVMPEGAATYLYVLRYPGIHPHNNAAELEVHDAVMLHRNAYHHLSGPEGMDVF